MRAPEVSVIVPAHDEAAYIGPCLTALLASEGPARAEILVVANGCCDATADTARTHAAAAQARGWTLRVIELPRRGKCGALNAGDAAAQSDTRVYLDADVTVDPPLLPALLEALEGEAPRYASGSPRVPVPQSAVTRAYARFWARLPFVTRGVPGCGLFAVNAAGRGRWGRFPDIIADDTFARLHFAPEERVRVAPRYSWPMAEGFRRLVRVRRRWNFGVAEVARLYPALPHNDDTRRGRLRLIMRRALSDPAGFATYATVTLAVRLRRSDGSWDRGR